MRDPLTKKVVDIAPSGIRKFFDIVSEMDNVISLGVGEPDFDTPWHIRDEGIYSLEKGRTFYTSNAGLKELREEICKYLKRRFALDYDPITETLITVGGSEAIDLAMRVMLDPGDEVLIPEPCYVSYVPCCILAGGKPHVIELQAKNEFRLTKEELLEHITEKTKILVLPFPNNPTGAIMSRKDLKAIAEVVEEKDLFVLSDEIYAELTYGGNHVSFAAGHEGADHHDQRFFQVPCHDRLASGLCLRTGAHHQADDKSSSVCDHVRSHQQPVCGCGGSPERRCRCGRDASGLQWPPPLSPSCL